MNDGDPNVTQSPSRQEDRGKKEAATEEHAETARKTAEAATGEASERADGDEEVGGPQGPEPTRFGDWERKGRCIDF